MRHLWPLLATLFFSTLSFPAFSTNLDAIPYKIGVLYWSMNIPGQVAMRKGLESRAEKINELAAINGTRPVKLICEVAGDAESGILNQIRQMKNFIAMKVDLIIVQPTDNSALSDCLIEANRLKIPVVAYDQYINPGRLSAYRTSDNYQAGFLAGEYIAWKFQGKKNLKLVLVDYPHVSSTVERLNGFLEALSTAGIEPDILQTYQAVEPLGGKVVSERLLKDFPIKGMIDVVFTVNDGGGLKIAEALLMAGRTEILHATVDGDPDSVKNIQEGKVTVIDSAQFCGPLGEEAMQAGYDLLQGKKVPYHALVPVFPVTSETMSQYPGWEGPIPKKLVKSWKTIGDEWSADLKIVKP